MFDEEHIVSPFMQPLSVQFGIFTQLEVLEIKKRQIKPEWQEIVEGIVKIPSLKFRRLAIST